MSVACGGSVEKAQPTEMSCLTEHCKADLTLSHINLKSSIISLIYFSKLEFH